MYLDRVHHNGHLIHMIGSCAARWNKTCSYKYMGCMWAKGSPRDTSVRAVKVCNMNSVTPSFILPCTSSCTGIGCTNTKSFYGIRNAKVVNMTTRSESVRPLHAASSAQTQAAHIPLTRELDRTQKPFQTPSFLHPLLRDVCCSKTLMFLAPSTPFFSTDPSQPMPPATRPRILAVFSSGKFDT